MIKLSEFDRNPEVPNHKFSYQQEQSKATGD